MIVGLGPGPAEWMTPEAGAAIEAASDIVGYGPYLDRLALRPDQRAHASDNRAELNRARLALQARGGRARGRGRLGRRSRAFSPWRRRCSRRSRRSREWLALDVAVRPGVTAMQAAAARLGAPLGHDFCAISLSDNLKPWAIVERRLQRGVRGRFRHRAL